MNGGGSSISKKKRLGNRYSSLRGSIVMDISPLPITKKAHTSAERVNRRMLKQRKEKESGVGFFLLLGRSTLDLRDQNHLRLLSICGGGNVDHVCKKTAPRRVKGWELLIEEKRLRKT